MINVSFPCLCCGFFTMGEPPGSFDICPICFWEDDFTQAKDPTATGGANGPSLLEAQANFERCGASDPRLAQFVRPAGREDRREPGWRPIDPGHDLIEFSPELSPGPSDDLSELNNPIRLYWWRPTYWRRYDRLE